MRKAKHFLQSIHKPNIRWEILEFNALTKMAKLKGPHTTFYSELTVKAMLKYGYKLETENAN